MVNKSFFKRIRQESVFGLVVILGLIIYLNTIDPYFTQIPFWIAAFLEMILALIFLKLRKHFGLLSILFSFVCMLVPSFLSIGEPSLASIKLSAGIYLLFIFVFTLYKPLCRFIEGDDEKRNIDIISHFKIPIYLPEGYVEEERKTYKQKGCNIRELYYEKAVGENISIIQSDGPIPQDTQIDKKIVYNEKVKGIDVTIESEEVSFRAKLEFQDNNISFKKAEWNNDGWYFVLTAEELSLEETRKVIASMIQ